MERDQAVIGNVYDGDVLFIDSYMPLYKGFRVVVVRWLSTLKARAKMGLANFTTACDRASLCVEK